MFISTNRTYPSIGDLIVIPEVIFPFSTCSAETPISDNFAFKVFSFLAFRTLLYTRDELFLEMIHAPSILKFRFKIKIGLLVEKKLKSDAGFI